MNIDVNLLNQINDKMYEIYKKYGEQTVINLLNYRLKNIKKGDIFICTHDIYDDRHKYINDAIKNGCKAIIIDKNIKNIIINSKILLQMRHST